MNKLKRAGVVLALAAAIVGGVASPAAAAGSVANSCAVVAKVTVQKPAPGGVWQQDLRCGEGTSNAWRVTVWSGPYYVKVAGRAPFCRQAGQWFYPFNRGYSTTAVITPTVRCR